MAIARNAGEEVVFKIKTQVPAGDGSFQVYTRELKKMARVVNLQPNEIQRLQEKGVTLNQGVSISIADEFTTAPDKITRADGTVMKVVDYTIAENISVFIADVPAMGAAIV